MQLRSWEEKDLPILAEIEGRCFPCDAWSQGMLSEVLKAPYQWSVLAEEDGKIYGYACLFSLFETAELLNIAVDTDYRGRGFGEKLLTAIHNQAKAMGAERILLEVRVSNAPAIALYTKHGYEKIAVRKRYYANGEDADIMEKKL